MTSRRVRLQRTAVLLAALATVFLGHRGIDTESRIAHGEHFVPDSNHVKVSALGFDALVADFYWLQAVQTLGNTVVGIEDKAPLLARLIDVVTTANPWVGHPYRFGAIWLTENEEQVRRANRLLRRGIAYHPADWRNRYHLGFNLFFYLEENLAAAEALEPAAGLPGAPPYLGALVARLRAGGGLDLAAGLLERLSRETEDEYARAEYGKALDEIQTERLARILDRAREEFWKRRGRDIESVEELLAEPQPVLRTLPPAHPHFPGFRWELDPDSGQIVSSFYRSRYGLHIHPLDLARQERWRARRKASKGI